MSVNPIEVVPYDPKWKLEFQQIKEMLESTLGDIPLAIEHVGSTSIEGLAAKPIIDIDVVIDSYKDLPSVIELLAQKGLIHQGNLGIEGREAFKRTVDDGFMSYNLYVCTKNGKGYLEHIAFRDFLRQNEWARNEYGELKYRLAEQYRHDREAYCESKTEFIKGILNKTIYSRETKKNGSGKKVAIIITSIIVLFSTLIFSMRYFVSITEIGGRTMYPTFDENDIVVSLRYTKALGPKLDRGSIVRYNVPFNPLYGGIGRIIGMPGDEIKIESGRVYVNDEELVEDYIEESIETTAQNEFPHRSQWVVPEGEVFVLGDNRRYDASYDSRNFGTIKKSDLRSVIVYHFSQE